jgi:hypothetical protein
VKSRNARTIMLVLFCTTAFPFSAQQPTLDPDHGSDQENQSVSTTAKTRDLKTDLEKMQALVEQMQRNVAFVSPGDTPLKHQFQLEIEMWQLLIRDMEKKTNSQQAQ